MGKANPHFDSSRFGLLFFSRGRGRGHAIPDIAIAEELVRRRDDVDIRFVSYGTGADTFTEFGHGVIDLDLPERKSTLETLVRAGHMIGWLRPQLVVAHEEFAVPPAARIFGVPALFITDWFSEPENFSMRCLGYADEVLFIDEPGIFEEPPYLKSKVHYVGAVLREFRYSKNDRNRAREELALPRDATIICVLPGSGTEQRAPIFNLVLAAFGVIGRQPKRLIWIAGEDHELLAEKTKERPEIIVNKQDWQMDRLMVASDLAITKTNRKALKELAALGIPSISLSYGLNEIDDAVAAKMPTNLTLRADSIDGPGLARHIAEILANGSQAPVAAQPAPGGRNGRVAAAERIAGMIDRVKAARASA